MHKIISIAVTVLTIISINGQNDNRLNGVDKDLEAIMEATMAPGFAVAVVDKDKVVFARGFLFRHGDPTHFFA